MAQGSGQQSTIDGLKKIYTELATLALNPDSQQHMQFLTGVQGAIQKYVMQQGMQAAGAQQQGAMQAAQQPMPGGGPGGPGGGPPGAGGPGPRQGPPPGAGGPQPGMSQAPNPDELRRLLGASGAMQ